MSEPTLAELRKMQSDIAAKIAKQEKSEVSGLVDQLESLGYTVELKDKDGQLVDLAAKPKAKKAAAETTSDKEEYPYTFPKAGLILQRRGRPNGKFAHACITESLMRDLKNDFKKLTKINDDTIKKYKPLAEAYEKKQKAEKAK